jgi:hypothetical protein
MAANSERAAILRDALLRNAPQDEVRTRTTSICRGSFIKARGIARGLHFCRASRKIRGRAGRRGSCEPTDPVASPRRGFFVCSAASSLSLQRPARGVGGLLCETPGGLSFLSTALDLDLHLAVSTEVRCDRQGPVKPTGGSGISQLGPPGRGVRSAPLPLHSPATAGRSRLTTPREAPSDGPACAGM